MSADMVGRSPITSGASSLGGANICRLGSTMCILHGFWVCICGWSRRLCSRVPAVRVRRCVSSAFLPRTKNEASCTRLSVRLSAAVIKHGGLLPASAPPANRPQFSGTPNAMPSTRWNQPTDRWACRVHQGDGDLHRRDTIALGRPTFHVPG